ncbi:unnamed protein product [Kluyveromyces dobzhanskii CBS 2104]|uniref:WGS project CCBQ000000000 data, contig 00046 n=1 Tax=Kluyveromyces dobzhanskii CBS 2104 TaxID=1427455 RepID=A0A0A8L9K4_9SACH|nr:unnamed protein product [Kluyveromyces dobzhanskii CBS 2104]
MQPFPAGEEHIKRLLSLENMTTAKHLKLACFMLCLPTVLAYGVGFHLTQVARVLPSHDQFTKAGSLFPDSVDQFDKLEVNWNSFVSDGLHLWHEKYESATDDHGLKQFLLGVYVGDVINTLQNFTEHGVLHVLANLEFNGSFEDSLRYMRGTADLIHLSCLLGQENIEWNYYLSTQIKLPLKEDILCLFTKQGIDVDWISVVGHLFDMLGVLHSELYLLQNKRFHALDIAYSISPGGPKLIKEHWRGGEWDILAELQEQISVIESKFGPTAVTASDTLNFAHESSSSILSEGLDSDRDNTYVTPLNRLSLFGTSVAKGEFLENEPCLAVGAPLEGGSGSIYIIPMSILGMEAKANLNITALYGSKVHTFRLLDYDYLVVSETGKQAVHFYLFGEKVLTILDPSANYQEVNFVTSADNGQIPDLILTCKFCQKYELGKATIIPGLNIIPFLITGKRNQVEFVDSIGSIVLSGPRSLSYQHYGASAVASQSFLLVTAQNIGLVYGYNLQKLSSGITPSFYVKEDAIIYPSEDLPWNWDKLPSSKHGLFGAEICVWTHEGFDFIAISELLFNKVYIYKDAGNSALEVWLALELDPLSDFNTVKYSIEFGKGIHFSTTEMRLYVSSPGSFNGAGAIWSVSMAEMQRTVGFWKSKHLIVNALEHLSLVNPETKKKGWSNFGSILTDSSSGNLIVSIPQFGYGDLHQLPLIGALLVH